MFLPYVQTIESNPQIEELLYYSFDLKDHNTKLKFLKKIFESKPEAIQSIYYNQSIHKLVSKLIDLLPGNDVNFIHPLIKYLDNENDTITLLAKRNRIENCQIRKNNKEKSKKSKQLSFRNSSIFKRK